MKRLDTKCQFDRQLAVESKPKIRKSDPVKSTFKISARIFQKFLFLSSQFSVNTWYFDFNRDRRPAWKAEKRRRSNPEKKDPIKR
jgi:hypothetical protein